MCKQLRDMLPGYRLDEISVRVCRLCMVKTLSADSVRPCGRCIITSFVGGLGPWVTNTMTRKPRANQRNARARCCRLTRIMLPETRNLAHSHCPSVAALMGISHKFVGLTSYGRHCGRSKFVFNLWVFSWEFIIFMGGFVGGQTFTLINGNFLWEYLIFMDFLWKYPRL